MVSTEVIDTKFWEYKLHQKLFKRLGLWKDQKDVGFKPQLDHPCFFSFGESCLYDEHTKNWKWESHPNDIYCWKFLDLKQPPCKVPIYNEEYLNWYKEMPEIQDPQQKLQKQISLNQSKQYYDPPGWSLNTYGGICNLLELCTEKKKKQLLQYYGQCGTKEKPPMQLLTSGKVKAQNYFVSYERRMIQQKIYLGQSQDRYMPSQCSYKTLKGTLYHLMFTRC